MASKLAVYDTGYDDERFEQIVSQTLHCIICTNVIKDPVMCQHNEHLFCRACITIHLMYSSTCPTCMDPLTVKTLRQARTVMNLLSELKIRCEFFDRGCGKFVQLGDLERHVADCGFAPVVCSNEGCELEVNKQDLLHHEKVCELRRVTCHSCNDIKREMNTMKVNLAAMDQKLDRNEKMLNRKLSETLERIEANTKAVENVAVSIELIQQVDEEEKKNQKEMEKRLNVITWQLEKIIEQTLPNVADEQEQTKEENKETLQESPVTEKACKNDDVAYFVSHPAYSYHSSHLSASTSSNVDSPSFSFLQTKKNDSLHSSDSTAAKHSLRNSISAKDNSPSLRNSTSAKDNTPSLRNSIVFGRDGIS